MVNNRKSRRAAQFGQVYKFRGLPISIKATDEVWCVSGQYFDGGGVLEWCYDEDDATHMLDRMSKYHGFAHLTATKFVDSL